MTSTLTAFNVSGNFTIYSSRASGKNNDGTFYFSTGTLDIDGTLTTSSSGGGTCAFDMNTGSKNGTLNLGGAAPFSFGTGTNTITLNSTSTTVDYNRSGDQTIYGTSYYNLKTSGSNTKSTDAATTVNGTLDVIAGTLQLGGNNITVTGATTILGTLADNSTSGTNTFNGTVSVTGSISYTAAETFTINNNLTLNSGSSISGSATGIVSATGTLSVNSGTSAIGQCQISIGGTSTITGTLEITNSIGTKTFTGNITVNGTWNNSGNSAITMAGNLTVNTGATFTAGTGIYTLSGASKEINGTISSLSIPSLTVSGSCTNKISSLTVATALSVAGTLTNNYTLTVSGTLGGWGSLTQGISGAYLYIASSTADVTLTASVSTNTVEYNGGAQTIKNTTYDILKISGSGGTKSPGNAITVSNNLYIDATGTIDLNTENATINGTTSVYGTLKDGSTTGTDLFVGKVTIYSGGVWNFTVAESAAFRGGLEHNGATFTSNTGTYNFNTNSQSISGSSAITFDGPVTVTGAITVTNSNTNAVTGVTFNNTLNGSAAGSTFDNRGIMHYTSSGSTNRPMTNGVLAADNSSSTVYYDRADDQTIKVPSTTYYNLIISGSGTKTPAAAISVNGDLTLSGSSTFADGGFQITGQMGKTFFINSGATYTTTRTASPWFPTNMGTTFDNNSTINISGNGTFILSGLPDCGNISFGGTVGTKTLANSFTANGNLTINNNTTLAGGSNIITVKGNVINNFTYTSSGSGKIYLNGGTALHQISGGTFGGLELDDSNGAQLQTSATINNLLSATTGDFDINSKSVSLGSGISIIRENGNFINGTFTFSTNTDVSYNPTSSISVGAELPSDATNLRNLTLNGSGLDLSLSNSITVNGTLTMTSGTLNLNGKNITLCSTCNISGETSTNRIYGSSGYIEVSGVTIDHASLNPGNLGATLDAANVNLGSVTVRRGHEVQVGQGNNSILRYYDITPSTTGLNLTSLKLEYFGGELNSINENSLTSFFSTNTGSTWREVAPSEVANSYVLLSPVNSFQRTRWVLGDGGSPLPVELLSFQGIYENNKVNLYWATASEINNDYFIVESSTDAKSFKTLTVVKGHGNFNGTLKYTAADSQPPLGVAYYRLKQTDFDGKFKYSDVIEIRTDENTNKLTSEQPYFNGNEIDVNVKNISTPELKVEIYTINGSLVYRNVYTTLKDDTRIKISSSYFSKGAVYFIRISDDRQSIVKKFVY
jgi:hypothetical protein